MGWRRKEEKEKEKFYVRTKVFILEVLLGMTHCGNVGAARLAEVRAFQRIAGLIIHIVDTQRDCAPQIRRVRSSNILISSLLTAVPL